MAASYNPSELAQSAVEMIEVAGEWYVRVIAPEGEIVKIFAIEFRAVDFAANQCSRLRLETYDRV